MKSYNKDSTGKYPLKPEPHSQVCYEIGVGQEVVGTISYPLIRRALQCSLGSCCRLRARQCESVILVDDRRRVLHKDNVIVWGYFGSPTIMSSFYHSHIPPLFNSTCWMVLLCAGCIIDQYPRIVGINAASLVRRRLCIRSNIARRFHQIFQPLVRGLVNESYSTTGLACQLSV
jgi:hypothetical protein